MKIFKQMTAFILVALISASFARSAPGIAGENSDLPTVQDSKVDRPEEHIRVHRAGLLWLTTSNMGYFGNPDTYDDPCTGKPAVNGEMPGGSGTDFLFVGGIMFGGYLDSATVDVSGTNAKVFQGPLVSTAYDGWTGASGIDDMPMEMWPINFEDDASGTTMGKMVETSNVEGKISCLFEEVYNPTATAEEQFNTMYTDKYVERTPYTGMDEYDLRDHIPLGIEVKQKSYAWSYDYAQKFVIIDYTLYNRNEDERDIYDFFMGMYLDCDIGMVGGDWTYNHADDLGGFIQKWDGYIDPATGEQKTVDLNLAWAADNDGRNYTGQSFYTATGEPGAGSPLDGATGIVTVRVLRNPNPNLRYAFNMYVANSEDEALDWGPHWKVDLHDEWKYDLTPTNKGYDDNNYDGITNASNEPLAGGRVEGRPCGDKGKYMVMSNDEFDYNQYDIIDIDLGTYTDPTYMEGTPYAQAEKWKDWLDPTEPLEAGEVHDGSIGDRNDLANGADTKYVLSFGPLGTEISVPVGRDTDDDGVIDTYEDKNVWVFAANDSLKLTLAFIVNDNFHTSLEQDPNYSDPNAMNPDDGIDPSLYDKGWYDALYNVVWAERVYDIPMHDTYKMVGKTEKGDGWYGEDVGEDGIYANTRVTTECWWTDPVTEYGGPDDGEADFELTAFAENGSPMTLTDVYGNVADSEDNLLPYGREAEDLDGIYGTTEEYGYMVKFDDASSPMFGEWVRYGYMNGRVDVGDGVPDFTGPPPPPSPKIKISYENNTVIVKWSSKEFFQKEDGTTSYSGPEMFLDPFTRVADFEGYQIQVSPDVNSLNYVEIFSVDKINYGYEQVDAHGEFLDSPFTPEDMLDSTNAYYPFDPQINAELKVWELVDFGDNRDLLGTYSKPGLYEYSAEPATRVINEGTALEETVDYHNYTFKLFNKLYAQENYIAVTSSDFGDPKTGTPALKSNPAVNGSSVIPTKLTSTDDVVVVPNPYRGDMDYEEMGWENTEGSDDWSEQDRKIVFMNIPLHSVIRIYTLAGDLVKTIGHNGNARVDANNQYGEYGASWNLINDNDQAVVSGIYLFSVQDVEDDGYEQIGKFVIIK